MSTAPVVLDYGREPARDRVRLVVGAAGLFAIFAYLLIYHFHHERRDVGHLGDFPTFYQAAQFAREHKDIYLAGKNEKQMYVYPPLIAFLYTPLTNVSELHAAQIMLVLTAAMLLASLLIASRSMLERLSIVSPGAVLAAAFVVSILNENELRAVMTMLETDSLMLLMFTLALWWLDRRPVLSGAALALAFNIKYLSIVALPYLILRRRWRAAGSMIVGSVFFALLPALLLGWQENLRCLGVAFGGLLRWVGISSPGARNISVHDIGDMLSVSITSGLARLLHRHGGSNAVVMLTAAIVGLLALGCVAILYRRSGFSLWAWPPPRKQLDEPYKPLVGLEWAGLITVALAFSPDTNVRHLVLAVIVNAAAVTLLLAGSRGRLLVGIVLIFVSFIMPVRGLAWFYFRYSIPGWCLLIGYLLILATGLDHIRRRAQLRTALGSGLE